MLEMNQTTKEFLQSIPSQYFRKRLYEYFEEPKEVLELFMYAADPATPAPNPELRTTFTEAEILTELLRRAKAV